MIVKCDLTSAELKCLLELCDKQIAVYEQKLSDNTVVNNRDSYLHFYKFLIEKYSNLESKLCMLQDDIFLQERCAD